MAQTSRKKSKPIKKTPKVPYHKKPDNMHPNEWQRVIRKQFVENNPFDIHNLGEHPVYSDFSVYNPDTGNTYKVAIRSNPEQIKAGKNHNFCSCYDFKTNRLGTCKHLEAVMRKLYRNTRLRKYFKTEYIPTYSSVYVKYDGERSVKLRIGSENLPENPC